MAVVERSAGSAPGEGPYDESYYASYGADGRPYSRDEPVWAERFGALADQIVAELGPRRVLDVGCALGFLVEALRDRGVEAWGVDASAYAIAQVRPDLRPFCWRGDARLLDDESYDLVTCFEVVEHLSEEDGARVLERLVAKAPLVLFSSSPDDEEDPTHRNVRPTDYWLEAFARLGAWPVPGVDFTAFAPHVLLLRRGGPPSGEEALAACAAAAAQAAEVASIRGALAAERTRAHRAEGRLLLAEAERGDLAALHATRAVQSALVLRALGHRLLPPGGVRHRWAQRGVGLVRRLAGRPTRLPTPPEALGARGERPRVLIVQGCGGDSGRFRCAHLLELVTQLGGAGQVVWAHAAGLGPAAEALADAADLVVLQRVGLTAEVSRLIAAARARGRPVVFETDDLLFDPSLDLDQVPGLRRLVPRGGPRAQRRTLLAADAVLCATPFLCERAAALGRPAHLLRNAFSPAMRAAADVARRTQAAAERPVLGYASGSPTHDADLARIAPLLLEVLESRPELELHLQGPVRVDPSFDRFGPRVVRRAFMPWTRLPQALAGFTVNLAPLDLGAPFCQGKSALKFLEAALVEVPTVASPNPAFREAIAPGVTGFLADDPEAWREALEALLDEPDLRRRVGRAAGAVVDARDGFAARASELAAILDRLGLPLARGEAD